MVSALVPGSNAPGSILFYSSICSLDLRTVPNNIILINMIVIVNNSNITKHNTRGGGTPLYKVYRYVPPQRVWFLSRLGLKTGIDFDNYGLNSGRVFGAGNIYESLQTYFSSQYVR